MNKNKANSSKAVNKIARKADPVRTGSNNLLGSYFKTYKTSLFLLALFTFILNFNTVFNGYCVDDHFVINEVTDQGFSALKEILTSNFTYHNGKGDSYRAIARASIAIENGIFTPSAAVHHFLNILYFIVCIFLTFYFFILILGREYQTLVFVILLVFVAHPVHVEVIASLKSRDELFCYLFGILTCIWGYKYYQFGGVGRIVLTTMFLILSLMSKENAPQYVPIVLLTCLFFGNMNFKRLSGIMTLSLAIIGLYLVFYFKVLSKETVLWDEDIASRFIFVESQLEYCKNFSERYGTAFFGLLYYLKILIFPFRLSTFYGYKIIPNVGFNNIWVIVSIFVYISLLITAIYLYKRNKIISYAILFYFCSLIIFSNLLVPVNGVVAERHIFLGSLPFCFLIAYALFRIFKVRFDTDLNLLNDNKPFLIVLGVLLSVYSIKTISRNSEWKDRLTLSAIDAKRNPDSGMVSLYYALELSEELAKEGADTGKIIPEIVNSFENVIRIDTNYAFPHIRLGNLYAGYRKNFERAEVHYLRALDLMPENRLFFNILSEFYQNQNDSIKLDSLMNEMADRIPGAFEPYRHYGITAFRKNQFTEAVNYFEKAVNLGCRDEEMIRFLKEYYFTNQSQSKLDSLNRLVQ